MDLRPDDPIAVALVEAIRGGHVDTLKHLLAVNAGLATATIATSRSLLHIATDWPGHFPNVAATVHALCEHGANVNARFTGPHTETPLHWAASTNDVAALDALLDLGADIEAPGAVIGGGTALADAVAFAQWNAARRLVERGARTTLWQAAALGLMEQVKGHLGAQPLPSGGEITNAFWCACHGGQLEAAKYLLGQGADLNWIGYDHLTPLAAAQRNGAEALVDWLRAQGAKRTDELQRVP